MAVINRIRRALGDVSDRIVTRIGKVGAPGEGGREGPGGRFGQDCHTDRKGGCGEGGREEHVSTVGIGREC